MTLYKTDSLKQPTLTIAFIKFTLVFNSHNFRNGLNQLHQLQILVVFIISRAVISRCNNKISMRLSLYQFYLKNYSRNFLLDILNYFYILILIKCKNMLFFFLLFCRYAFLEFYYQQMLELSLKINAADSQNLRFW